MTHDLGQKLGSDDQIVTCNHICVYAEKKGEYSEEEWDSVDGDFPAYCIRSSPKQGEQQNCSDECVLLEESVTHNKVWVVL